jgi:hypothetical protein
LAPGAIEHVVGDAGDRAEAAAFHEEGLFVKGICGLDDFAIGAEKGGLRESLHDELEAHDTVVHF